MISQNRGTTSLLVTSLLAAAGSATLLAGPLDPPPGPITSTYKTLTEVEPRTAINATNTPGDADSVFKITQPGSYYLTGNITGVVGKNGIEIAASGVTLDLNGFDLVGVASMGGFDGITVSSSLLSNIAVMNGSVRSWGDKGVEIVGVNNRVERVRSSGNTGAGFGLANGCQAVHCTAAQNGGAGFTGAFGCSAIACISYSNTGDGFVTASMGSSFVDCVAHTNAGAGFNLGSGATVVNCSASGCGGNGFTTGITAVVTNCSANLNTGSGISVASASTVAGCSVRSNTLDGIVCTANCTIRDNTSSTNGNSGDGANIHATGTDNRIEGNNCTAADRGIDVDAPGNIIIRNTCSGAATNWDVAAGNVILVVSATTAGPVIGNSGGAAPGSTDPSANYTY